MDPEPALQSPTSKHDSSITESWLLTLTYSVRCDNGNIFSVALRPIPDAQSAGGGRFTESSSDNPVKF